MLYARISRFCWSKHFYDAFLVDVTSEDRMDRISTRGFALGYIGSTIPFIGCIALIILAQKELSLYQSALLVKFHLRSQLFGGDYLQFNAKNVEQTHYIERHPRPITMSFKRLADTFKNIKEYKTVFMFLIAYFSILMGSIQLLLCPPLTEQTSVLVQQIY